MFNIKYNFLVLIQIVLNALNALLLIKVFGVSGQVDAYLLAISILSTVQLVQLAFSEQFIIFYLDTKNKSADSAKDFYNSNLFISILIGFISLFILLLFKGLIIKVFAFNIDSVRLNYLNHISLILFLGALFIPINALNGRLLNAEQRYSIPYILSTLPTLFIVIAQLSILFLNKNEIIYLAYGQTLGWALSAIAGTIFIAKKIIPYKFHFYHSECLALFKNSFTTQMGGNIYNTLLPVCINNLLVTMSAGYVSYFYYAKRVIDTLKLLNIGPSSRILKTNITNFWVDNNVSGIKKDIKRFLKGNIALMCVGIVLSFIFLPFALKIISMGKLTSVDIANINYIFLALCPWYLVAIYEIPYILVIFSARKSKVIILTNILFISLFFITGIITKNKIGIYSIALGGLVGQIFNFIIFKNYSEKLLKKHCTSPDDNDSSHMEELKI